MCRSKKEVPGGRRCFFHEWQTKINRREATLIKKEEELAALYRLKMKPADVQRRIRELEAVIAGKRSYIAQLENHSVTPPEGISPDEEISRTEEDIRILEDEKLDLEYIRDNSRRHRRRIEGLEATIAEKKAELRELKANAEKARAEYEAERQAEADLKADEQREKDALNKTKLRIYNEDADLPRHINFVLTPEEREWVDANRGEETASEFLLRRSITAEPVFSTSTAAALLASTPVKTRHDKSAARKNPLTSAKPDLEVVGRKPSIDKAIRSEKVAVDGEVKGRSVIRYYEAQMANEYSLSLSQYARRRALGLDLYANEGDISRERGEARLEALMRREERAYLPNLDPETGRYSVDSVEDLAEWRKRYDEQAQREAYEKTVEKFGAEAVGAVFAPYFGEMKDESLPFDTHHRAAA